MSDFSDPISGNNLNSLTNYLQVNDRFDKSMSAIYFNNGFSQVTSDYYFYEQFTVTLWIKLISYTNRSTIIELGNGASFNSFIIGMIDLTPNIYVRIYRNSNYSDLQVLNYDLNLNVWYHFGYSFKNNIGNVYINGEQIISGPMLTPIYVMRSTCNLGKSYYYNSYLNAVLDDIKIFRGSLSLEQMKSEYLLTSQRIVTLINYWPFSNLTDVVGGKNLFAGTNYVFVNDRFNFSNSAIYFNNGYLQAPSGYYFSNDFSITFWFYIVSYKTSARILDFNSGVFYDVFISFNQTNLYYYETASNSICPTYKFDLKVWYHIGLVRSQKNIYFYVNGQLINMTSTISPKTISFRKTNFIGLASWSSILSNDFILDELKFYQGALNSSEVQNDYINDICFSNNQGKY